jgi:hypothetical protein
MTDTGRAAVRRAGRDSAATAIVAMAGVFDAMQQPDTITSCTTVPQHGAAGDAYAYEITSPAHGSQQLVTQGLQQVARRCRWQQPASASNAASVVTAQTPNAITEPRVFLNISRSPREHVLMITAAPPWRGRLLGTADGGPVSKG